MSISAGPNFSLATAIKTITEANGEAFDDVISEGWNEAFAYQGFSPQALRNKIEERIRKMVDVPSNLTAVQAIKLAVYLAHERGNSLEKIKKSMGPNGLALITSLDKYFGFHTSSVRGNPLAVSLVRVAQVFPEVSALHTMSEHHKNMVVSDAMVLPGETIPPIMKSPAFSALIPSGKSYTSDLIDAFTLYQIEFSKKIMKPSDRASKRGMNYKEWAAEVQPFISNGVNGSTLASERQEALLRKGGVLTSTGGLSKVVKDMCKEFADRAQQV